MNLFKNRSGAIKGAMVILTLAFVIASVSYIIPAFAETHSSVVTVTPHIVPASSNVQFVAHVECTAGPDPIHEFRVYEPLEFSGLSCDSVSGWYAPQYGYTTIGGDEYYYCQWNAMPGNRLYPTDTKDFTFYLDTSQTECCRDLFVETRDDNGYYDFHNPQVCVDTSDPITTKSFIGPQKIVDGIEWIDGVTLVDLTAIDPDPHPAGVAETWYVNIWAEQFVEQFQLQCNPEEPCWDSGYCQFFLEYADEIPEEWWQLYVEPFPKQGESCHVLFYYSIDKVGNVEDTQVNCFFVDTTAPTVEKDNGDAIPDTGESMFMTKDNPNGDFHWLTTQMPITFTCIDQGPHPSNDEELCFKVSYDYPNWDYITEQYCTEPLNKDGYCCVPVDSKTNEYDFYFKEESMHNLEYYCIDAVEKDTDVHVQYYKVDDTPPHLVDKWINGPYYAVEGTCPPTTETDVCHLDGESTIEIYVEDGGDICAVDEVWCQWGYYLDEGKFYGWYEAFPIWFPEETKHDLVIECYDKLGNKMVDEETFYVDKTEPETTKTYSGPKYPVTVKVSSPSMRFSSTGWGGWSCPEGTVVVGGGYEPEPADHPVAVSEAAQPGSVSGLYPVYPHYTYTPPETGWVVQNGGEAQDLTVYAICAVTHPTHITSETEVHLDATDDVGLHDSGVAATYYRDIYLDNPEGWRYCYDHCGEWVPQRPSNPLDPTSDGWTLYSEHFHKTPESCHIIEYYSVDNVDKVEDIKWQCVFVDDTAPTLLEKLVGEPKVEKGGKIYITGETDITMRCEDQGDHPVDYVSLWYRYRISDDCATWGDWLTDGCEGDVVDGWCDGDGQIVEKTINFPQDSCHELEYYCVDALGHETSHEFEIDVVDNQPPEITKTVIGPQMGDCPPGIGQDCYIDGETVIHVEVIDPEPHPVNEVMCDWTYTVYETGFSEYHQKVTPPFDIQFQEESTHILTIECEDALGNKVIDEETFLVDKTPPETTKTYEGPQYTDGTSKWINFDTMIYLSAADDKGPHDSGVAATYWRDQIVDNMNCEEPKTSCFPIHVHEDAGWNLYTAPFNKDEESCHMIEYYSVDNVDKKEPVKAQCVFVDNTPPKVDKEVGEPSEEWEGDDTFYPGLMARCEAGEIDCWRVTLGTPLSLMCEDQQPHPVNNDIMCFHIHLDGEDPEDDVTQEYCDHYDEDYDLEMEGDWCCGEEIDEFYFLEESQHDLEVNCTDILGNEGPIDEEKFKVEGCPFEICLNKKWNLISVPFTLFNDDPDVVFENVEEDIISVWMYDSECGGDGWCVWTPDGGGDLEIKPGWGYWVLSQEDGVCFEIAGSLMSPQEVPPSRTLQPSWNLIGYYGNTGFNDEWWFHCNNFDECYIPDRPVYCALNSLVDTQVGFPRWSSLYTYYNEGDDDAYWDGLDACVGMWWGTEYMEPGQGYWIEMDVADGYAPATNCIWNTELKCVLEWPY